MNKRKSATSAVEVEERKRKKELEQRAGIVKDILATGNFVSADDLQDLVDKHSSTSSVETVFLKKTKPLRKC